MLQQNEKKAMKSANVCCGVRPVQHMVLPLRVCFLLYLKMLLVLALCAGFALSANTTTGASTTVPTSQSGQEVIYFIEVTVEVQGSKKDEEDIIDWLQPVIQNNLQTCGPPVTSTTAAPTISTSTFARSTTVLPTLETNTTETDTASHTTTNVTATTPITSTSPTTSDPITTKSTTASTTISTSATTATSASTTLTSNTASTTSPSTTSTTEQPTTASESTSTSTATTQSTGTTASTAANPTTTQSSTASTPISTATTTTSPSTTRAATTASTTPTATTSKTEEPTTTTSKSTSTNTATPKSPGTTASQTDKTTSDGTTAIKTSPVTTATEATKKKPSNNPNPNSEKTLKDRRIARDISVKSTGIFKDFEASCLIKESIRKTTCFVDLTLKERVNPCCILQTLCAANKLSTSITVTGKRAEITGSLQPNATQCNNPSEDGCVYTGSTGSTCAESGPDYSIPSSNSTQCENKCNCSMYCSKTDAYYIFNITTDNSEITESYLEALLAAIKTTPGCPSCPLPDIASKYKDGSIACTTDLSLNCKVVVAFSEAVPICALSDLLVTLLSAQDINMEGALTRAAICGNIVGDAGQLLQSSHKLIDVNLTPDQFCTVTEATNLLNCESEETVIAKLNEQCLATTTAAPNTTTSLQPNTTLSVNETMNTTATTNATSNPVNETTTAASTTEDSNLAKADALLEMTKDASNMTSSQVAQVVSELEKLLSGPNVSVALGNVSIGIVSNLLGASETALENSATSIIGIVDTVGLKLVLPESTVRTTVKATQYIFSEDVALTVQQADGTNFEETYFSIQDPNNIQVGVPEESSSVPQGSIRLPPSLTQNLTAEEQQMVTRVQFNFYQKSALFQDKAMGGRILNSGILGASVSNVTISGLQDDVIISLRNIQPVPANYVATCVFWDFTLNGKSGGWNSAGCYVQNSTDNETVCRCNHLTSFGILLDISRGTITSRIQATILTFITYIGCGISAIFLAVTLLTYLAFGKLRKDIPSKILIHLCLALLLLNLVFLVDAWLALYPDAVGLCISTAWFLHYFLLVAFTWMGLEAVHMYIALVKVFNSYVSHYMLKFSFAGWGIPMIVVIIVIAIDKDNYGLVSYGKFSDGTTDEFCWIKNDVAFYVAVVAYFCAIFLFNMVMFIVVLVQLRRLKKQNPHNLQNRTTLQDVRSVLGITLLLGLTWGFAFFAWGPLNLPFMYLFAIFNSLQGFFIFVFHCAVKDNVRRQWRTYLCCGHMRLAENSEWSRTATQKTTKKSSMIRITSLQSSKSNNSSSSSSYLVSDSSDQTNGFGSPFSDRIITSDEDPSMDVILNELNSQYRRL